MTGLMTKITLTLTLTICAAVAVSAQVKSSGNGVIGVGLITGVESAAATCEMSIAMCYGNTYVLNSFGEWESFHLTVALNYFNSMPAGGNGFAVTSGTWSLVVMRENQYAGTLYGEIKNGSIVFPAEDSPPREKIIMLELSATGGLGVFKNKRPKKITGSLKMTTDLTSRETAGRLDLTLR